MTAGCTLTDVFACHCSVRLCWNGAFFVRGWLTIRRTFRAFCTEQGKTALLAQWDIERNLPLTPDDVTFGSHKKVWWTCPSGHSWQAMVYTLAVHIPIVGLALLPVLFGLPLVLAPLHIAFLELVIDPTCSIVFEAEEGSTNLMEQPPRRTTEPLLSSRHVFLSLLQGSVVTAAVVGLYAWMAGQTAYAATASTAAFVVLVAANAVLIFILPPSWEELRSRLERRGEDPTDVIEMRLKNASEEMAQAHTQAMGEIQTAHAATEAARAELVKVQAKAEAQTEAHAEQRKTATAEAERTADRMTKAEAERDTARQEAATARESVANLAVKL